MYQSGRAGDAAKKPKSLAKSGRVDITASIKSEQCLNCHCLSLESIARHQNLLVACILDFFLFLPNLSDSGLLTAVISITIAVTRCNLSCNKLLL